jgi:hypothetical protein
MRLLTPGPDTDDRQRMAERQPQAIVDHASLDPEEAIDAVRRRVHTTSGRHRGARQADAVIPSAR